MDFWGWLNEHFRRERNVAETPLIPNAKAEPTTRGGIIMASDSTSVDIGEACSVRNFANAVSSYLDEDDTDAGEVMWRTRESDRSLGHSGKARQGREGTVKVRRN